MTEAHDDIPDTVSDDPVTRILNHSSSPTRICMCGNKVEWLRWRLKLCDKCAEDTSLHEFAMSRVIAEHRGTPREVAELHRSRMEQAARTYIDSIAARSR